jgi:hypothetical protein
MRRASAAAEDGTVVPVDVLLLQAIVKEFPGSEDPEVDVWCELIPTRKHLAEQMAICFLPIPMHYPRVDGYRFEPPHGSVRIPPATRSAAIADEASYPAWQAICMQFAKASDEMQGLGRNRAW